MENKTFYNVVFFDKENNENVYCLVEDEAEFHCLIRNFDDNTFKLVNTTVLLGKVKAPDYFYRKPKDLELGNE